MKRMRAAAAVAIQVNAVILVLVCCLGGFYLFRLRVGLECFFTGWRRSGLGRLLEGGRQSLGIGHGIFQGRSLEHDVVTYDGRIERDGAIPGFFAHHLLGSVPTTDCMCSMPERSHLL